MPTVSIDALVAEDTTFAYAGREFVLPGDLPVALTFSLADALHACAEAEQAGDAAAMADTNAALFALLLEAFRLRDPELEELPFGLAAWRVVTAHLLVQLGLAFVTADTEPEPSAAAPNRAARRSSSKSKTAARA